jgi:hypothetical protein
MKHKVHWHADEWVVPGTWYVLFVAGFGFTLGEDFYYALTGLVGICRG